MVMDTIMGKEDKSIEVRRNERPSCMVFKSLKLT